MCSCVWLRIENTPLLLYCRELRVRLRQIFYWVGEKAGRKTLQKRVSNDLVTPRNFYYFLM